MKTKDDIVKDWLVRYTKRPIDSFAPYILLTNFNNYVELFARQFGVEVTGRDGNMPNASASGMTIINFGIGSPNAALIMDLLSAIKPKAALFLGKCGGLKDKNHVGDYILPSAAIRGEGTSNDYFPPEVPALPAFNLQRAVSSNIRDIGKDYWTGTVYTTNRRSLLGRIPQLHTDRRTAADLRHADARRRHQDIAERPYGDIELRGGAPHDRHQVDRVIAAQQPYNQASALRINPTPHNAYGQTDSDIRTGYGIAPQRRVQACLPAYG